MSARDLVHALSSTQPFQHLEDSQLRVLAERMEIVHLDEGASVFDEGDVGDSWYLILSGEITIVRHGGNGSPSHTLASLERGDSFGEMALLEGTPRMASASAFSASRLGRLPRESFDALLADHHPSATQLLRHMSKALCQRLRDVTFILQDIVDNPAPMRTTPSALTKLMHAVMAHN